MALAEIGTRKWKIDSDGRNSSRRAFDVFKYERNVPKEDIITFFGEVRAQGSFSFKYRINDAGKLETDADNPVLVSEMMANSPGIDYQNWTEQMIPMLEWLPEGASAAYLSARRDDGETVEGHHDYLYIYEKVDGSQVDVVGFELNLTSTQADRLINAQLGHRYLETEDSNWQERRSQMFFYPPSYLQDSGEDMIPKLAHHILTKAFGQIGLPDKFGSPEAIKNLIESDRQKQVALERETQMLVDRVNRFVAVGQLGRAQDLIDQSAVDDFRRQYPDLYQQALQSGLTNVVLPCGRVDLGFFGGNYLIGSDIIPFPVSSSEYSYKNSGKCVYPGCGRYYFAFEEQLGPCKICKSCEKKIVNQKRVA